MIAVPVVAVMLCAVVWVVARAGRTIGRARRQTGYSGPPPDKGPRPDLPTAILAFSAQRIRGERDEWADAMAAELERIEDPTARAGASRWAACGLRSRFHPLKSGRRPFSRR